jgi:hypothetical protein
VAVAIGHAVAILDRIEAEDRAAAEVNMGAQDSGVDDVDVDPASIGSDSVAVAERQVALVYPVQTPGRCRGLGPRNAHDLVGLNGEDVRVFSQLSDVGRLHLHREAAQCGFVYSRHPPAMILAQPSGL